MLKWLGFLFMALTVVWMVMQKNTLSWGSLLAGASLSSAALVMFLVMKTEKPEDISLKNEERSTWELRLEEVQSRSAQTIDQLNQEIQKMQQRALRSEQRCLSYQKLVDVHQHEIEKLRQDNQTIADQLVQKERKLSQLQLAHIEPDLFDAQRRQAETQNRELKKQLNEKQNLLHEARSTLSQTQHELVSDVTDLLQKLKAAEDEKDKLQSELVSLQQMVAEFSVQKEAKKTRKKKVTEELESRDLLA